MNWRCWLGHKNRVIGKTVYSRFIFELFERRPCGEETHIYYQCQRCQRITCDVLKGELHSEIIPTVDPEVAELRRMTGLQ